MLRFDPSERLTVEEALAHPYLASVRSEAKEMCSAVPMSVQEEVIGEDLDHLYANVSTALTHMLTYKVTITVADNCVTSD